MLLAGAGPSLPQALVPGHPVLSTAHMLSTGLFSPHLRLLKLYVSVMDKAIVPSQALPVVTKLVVHPDLSNNRVQVKLRCGVFFGAD